MNNFDMIAHLFSQDPKSYLSIDSIPWAYPNSQEKFLEWSAKVHSFYHFENEELSILQNKLNQKSLTKITSKRIQKYISDKKLQIKSMQKLLDQFKPPENFVPLIDRQNILSYQELVFRDWCYDSSEVNTYINFIKSKLTGNEKNILVLGAGACKLSHELALSTKANIISTDINPYLFSVVNNLYSGKHLKLIETIPFAKSIEDISKKWELKPIKKPDNHFLVYTDFESLPFKNNSFDLVIGCWFFDIIETELDQSLPHINTFLKNDGRCIYIGPSNFHKESTSKMLTSEEIIERFQNSYSNIDISKENICYLDNPYNSQKRYEDILLIHASSKLSEKNLTHLKEEKIQVSPSLLKYKQKLEIFNRILKYVNHDISFEELAKKLESEFGFTPEEALFYSKNFMQKILLEI